MSDRILTLPPLPAPVGTFHPVVRLPARLRLGSVNPQNTPTHRQMKTDLANGLAPVYLVHRALCVDDPGLAAVIRHYGIILKDAAPAAEADRRRDAGENRRTAA